jgi:type II secretion system protein G
MSWNRHSVSFAPCSPFAQASADAFEIDHPISINHQPSTIPGNSAFTLVELMTVIAIIAVLAGLILGVAGYATRKADYSRAMGDMEKIKNALEEYRLAYGSYPTNTVANNSSNWVSALWRQDRPFLVLKGWSDPARIYPAVDPWGNDYRYFHVSETNAIFRVYATNNNSRFGYDLWSEGPNLLDPSDNIDNWSASRF